MGETELDGVLGEMEEAAGRQAALLIAREHGGTRLFIPANLPNGHPLAALVGRDAAKALARALGPRWINVPFGDQAAKHRALKRMDLHARPAREIARELGTTERTVYRHRARRRNPVRRDPDLFGDD